MVRRREWLGLFSVAAWGQSPAGHAQHEAVPFEKGSASPTARRRDIARMKAGDEALEMFRAAVKEMKRRSEKNKLDPLGWYQNGMLHALFCATHDFDLQVHYCWFFLPWHRAYLAFLERKMRAVIGEPKLMLPYWDWSRSPQIPEVLFGAGNPLADATRIQRPGDVIPGDYLDVGPALRAREFAWFGGYAKAGPTDPQIEGILEQGAHNNTHNWIGGNMAGFASAGFDPMFGMHHGNVDRLWEAWLRTSAVHRNPENAAWLDYAFYFHDERGRMVRIRIGDLIDTGNLGYRYDDLEFRLTCPQEAERAQEKRRFCMLRFARRQVPMHPYCARVFVAKEAGEIPFEPWTREYAGTVTLLPVADHKNGYLDEWVNMVLEVSAEQAAWIEEGSRTQVWLAPVALRGRQIPLAPLALQNFQLRLL